jgi:transposase
MPKTRKSHPPSLKAKVAVEAIKAHKTAAQIAQMFGVHPTQVGGWKKQALAGLPDIFGNGREQLRQQANTEKDELYKQIGQLKSGVGLSQKPSGAAEPCTCWTRNSRHRYACCAGRNGRSLFWCSVNPSKNMVWGWLADLILVTPSGDPV